MFYISDPERLQNPVSWNFEQIDVHQELAGCKFGDQNDPKWHLNVPKRSKTVENDWCYKTCRKQSRSQPKSPQKTPNNSLQTSSQWKPAKYKTNTGVYIVMLTNISAQRFHSWSMDVKVVVFRYSLHMFWYPISFTTWVCCAAWPSHNLCCVSVLWGWQTMSSLNQHAQNHTASVNYV